MFEYGRDGGVAAADFVEAGHGAQLSADEEKKRPRVAFEGENEIRDSNQRQRRLVESRISPSPSISTLGPCTAAGQDALFLRRRLLLAELLDHLLLRRAGHRLVLGELHRELALALRRRAEVRRVAEHLAERDVRGRDQVALDRLGGLDDAAALVELADDLAQELLGGLDLDVHDRLAGDRA